LTDEYPKVLVALTTSKKWHARFLCWLMQSRFHHAMLFLNLKEFGGWTAIDIDKNGPHMISTKKAFERISDYACCYSKQSLFPGIAKCRDYMGNGYDRPGVISGVILLFLRRLFGLNPKRTYQDPLRMYCVEYVASVLKYSNVQLFRHVNVALLDTLSFHKIMEDDPDLIRFNISKLELLNEA